ncbi:SMC-Scp complex subunit ScpB [Hydrogenophilus hirschii]|jgi:segregation and condensation protein B|nr:SMC-Scp complex subunit ScpB [Hydrogenophilus thermoluteolus]
MMRCNQELSAHWPVRRILEAILFAADRPLTIAELRQCFDPDPGSDIIASALAELQREWEGRALSLVCVAEGWRFRTVAEVQPYLARLFAQQNRHLSRAMLETLAIIAYQGPVTRGEISEIRGVELSPNLLRQLEARGWIEIVGHRDGPGRPALWAITPRLLSDLGLKSRDELPQLPEVAAENAAKIRNAIDHDTQ